MRNKKGNVTDIAFLIVSLLFVAFFGFVAYFVFGRMSTALLANPEINASPDAVSAINSINTSNSKIDYFVLATFVGLALGIIITSWFLGGNPIFIILYFLGLVLLVVVAMIVSNTWETITQKYTIWGTTINNLPITNNLVTYLPIYITIVGFLGMVAMFAKPFMDTGGGGY